jgi:hypothetical protein
MTHRLAAVAVAALAVAAAPAYAFSIDIEPGAYNGIYGVFPPNAPGLGFTSGPSAPDLAPGTYQIDTGATVAGSAFTFDVDAAGQVSNVNPAGAAFALGSSVLFNNVAVTVNPNQFAGSYYLSPFHPQPSSGVQTVVLVPDLVYHVDDGSFIENGSGSTTFYFSVDDTGLVTPFNTVAATGGANVLTLANVQVRIDPTDWSGSYRVGADQYFQGVHDVMLIPSLLVGVFIVGESPGYIVPLATQVTPSTLTLPDGNGQPHTFNLSLPQAIAVASAVPTVMVQGATQQTLTVSGTSFAAGASLTVSGTGVTVSAVNVLGPTQLVATLDVAAGAPTGSRDLTVTNPGGATATGTGLLSIVSPQDYVADIRTTIGSLADAGAIAAAQANNLLTSLANVAKQIGLHNNAASGMLTAMINKLDAFLSAGKVTQAAHDTLVADLQALRGSLP